MDDPVPPAIDPPMDNEDPPTDNEDPPTEIKDTPTSEDDASTIDEDPPQNVASSLTQPAPAGSVASTPGPERRPRPRRRGPFPTLIRPCYPLRHAILRYDPKPPPRYPH
ncbi:hypothetical protein FRC12_019598 [Ceratobasidium sp. 428]|nr:hypothetical protein FRC12_019598 [Ceratobasidium sp. 428]